MYQAFTEWNKQMSFALNAAEGRARTAEIVKSPQFLNLDHANLRRNRKTSSVFEPRPRESPQRVAIPSDDQTPAPAP